MKNVLYLIVALIFSQTFVLGQNRINNYSIHLANGPTTISSSLELNWKNAQVSDLAFYQSKSYVLLQLNTIPTTDQKEILQNQGIELIQYIPNFAWIASVDSSISVEKLTNLDVRNLTPFEASWKMSAEMNTGIIPPYAGTTENITARVLFWKSDQSINPTAILQALNFKSTAISPTTFELQGSLVHLKELAQHPLVQFIEFIEPPLVEETLQDEAQRSISTYVSNNPGKNYYFDGAGVKIGEQEGDIIDTLENPNFRSRIDRSAESGTTVNGHKTGVALRMAGAGNINPDEQGAAFGSTIYSGGLNFTQSAINEVTIINQSFGWGCSSDNTTYNSSSASYDNLLNSYPTFNISFSAGNDGSGDCYAGMPAYGNITGLPKMAKNLFVVGSSTASGQLAGFSSRGPSKDGRILPHIVAPGGGGTSHASPNLSGVYAQINHAYRYHNGGTIPNSALLKAILLNTADDMNNPGPDFQTGYGHVNARRAYEVIRQGQYVTAQVMQGTNNTHSIVVPANAKELKVLVYWSDRAAVAGIVSKSLVNDIDIVLENPNAVFFEPWILNPTFGAPSLNDNAVRGIDTLNNVEQITLKNPISGTYELSVIGASIPQGPQEYHFTFELVFDEIFVTSPHGGEKLVPSDVQRIRWDACDSNQTFDLSYTLDNGSSWNSIATGVSATSRYYDWSIPSAITDQAKIKVERGATVGTSDTTFTILSKPSNLDLIWSCTDSSLFTWDTYPNTDGYVVYRIVGDYMDSIAFTTNNTIVLNGLSLTENEYVSVGLMQNGVIGKRMIAITREPSDINCVGDNLGVFDVLSLTTENLPSCMSGANGPLEINVRNWGVNTVNTIPLCYAVNGGTIIHDTLFTTIVTGSDYNFTFQIPPALSIGLNTISVWTDYPFDGDHSNDTITFSTTVYSSTSSNPNLSENFDSFTNCDVSWGCETMICDLSNGWFNVTNLEGDQIDWRTDLNGTGTGSTGPSADHTSGIGKYLYLESSGPGGVACSNKTALLYSPCLDMTGINQAELSLWYNAYGATIGELHVDAIADGVLYSDLVAPVIGNQGTEWFNLTADLSQFTDKQLVLVIRGKTGNGFTADLAIDDINISISPIAAFNSAENQVCSSEIITLTNSSQYADTYEWTITPNTVTYQSGTDNTSATPEVTFDSNGSYTIQLIATNGFGSDTLVYTDYIYSWETAPTLTSNNPLCNDDDLEVFSSNNNQLVQYYLNSYLESTGNNSSWLYSNVAEGDSVYVIYTVNPNCILYSDTIIVEYMDVETGIYHSGNNLIATANNAYYQWIDCENDNTEILGETAQVFLPENNGEYALIVTENGCSDTSDCLVYEISSVNEITSNQFKLYPNPTKGDVTIQWKEIHDFIRVIVYNGLGQEILVKEVTATNKMELNLDCAPGIYCAHILIDGSLPAVISVVKN